MAPSPDDLTDEAPVLDPSTGSGIEGAERSGIDNVAVPEAIVAVPEALDTVPEALDAVPEALDAVPEALDAVPEPVEGFRVSLTNFDGPFDLLLNLISKHEMDITEVSLSAVTNEFITYLKELEHDEELDQASEFLVVAATLLDMKVAGLLPQGELVDAESVALLEARDLLFARLLQYRAFKEVSAWFARCLVREDRRHTRAVRLDEKYRRQTPELVWTLNVDDFAAIAMLAFAPKELPNVGLDHLHAPLVSIREQAAIVVTLLRNAESLTFRELVAGATEPGIVVARFISVLELYRHAALSFEQLEPLGELTLRWATDSWSDETLASLGADYDR